MVLFLRLIFRKNQVTIYCTVFSENQVKRPFLRQYIALIVGVNITFGPPQIIHSRLQP